MFHAEFVGMFSAFFRKKGVSALVYKKY